MTFKRVLLVGLIGIGAIVALAVIALAVFVWQLNPNAYKPRIEAAATTALGRKVTLNGPMGLAFSLRPTMTAQDVTIANPPGFSSPVMARVQTIDLQLDLLALLGRRLVVQKLAVGTPQITLERNAAGADNWTFAPPPRQPPPAPASTPSPPPSAHARPLPFVVEKVQVQHATVTYRDDRTSVTRTFEVPQIDMTAASPTSPVHLTATASGGNDRFDLSAQTGPLNRILAGAGPWPLNAKLHATGAIYDVTLDLSAPKEDQPLSAVLAGKLRGKPFSIDAHLGATPAASGAMSISFHALAADSALNAQGSIADPTRLAGVNIAINGQSADLSTFGAFVGDPLPSLRNLAFSGVLADVGGLPHGAALHQLRIAAEQGDVGGDVQAVYAGRPSVRAALAGTRLDLSALRVPSAGSPAPSPGVPGPPAQPSAPPQYVISDKPLPFEKLGEADADISLKFGAIQSGRTTLQNVVAAAQLTSGALALKAQAMMGGGPVDLIITADTRANPVPVALALSSPSLPAAALLAALGSPDYASGNLAITANLRGAGASPHAIAADLNGQVMLTMGVGTIDTRLLQRSLGPAIAQANPLALLSHGETSQLRCVVAKASAVNGQVSLAPLLLSSGLITLSGSGTANLGGETLDLHLRPEGRAGGVAFSVPMEVTGSFRSPRIEVARNGAANAGAAVVLGLLTGKGTGSAAGNVLSEAGPSCPAALAEAQGVAAPQPTVRPAAPSAPKVPDARTLLRRFLH